MLLVVIDLILLIINVAIYGFTKHPDESDVSASVKLHAVLLPSCNAAAVQMLQNRMPNTRLGTILQLCKYTLYSAGECVLTSLNYNSLIYIYGKQQSWIGECIHQVSESETLSRILLRSSIIFITVAVSPIRNNHFCAVPLKFWCDVEGSKLFSRFCMHIYNFFSHRGGEGL